MEEWDLGGGDTMMGKVKVAIMMMAVLVVVMGEGGGIKVVVGG